MIFTPCFYHNKHATNKNKNKNKKQEKAEDKDKRQRTKATTKRQDSAEAATTLSRMCVGGGRG